MKEEKEVEEVSREVGETRRMRGSKKERKSGRDGLKR